MIGTAGWTIPKAQADAFPGTSHLDRYAGRFAAAEINSSFYRPHRPATYQRWAVSVPDHFRFAVKVPKEITHVRRLADVQAELDRFLTEIATLGEKLGPLLIQLPPSFRFDDDVVCRFLELLRDRFGGDVVCEPRNATWFTNEVDQALRQFRIGRVAADPPCVPDAASPGGFGELAYYRLHGSPRVYYSGYPAEALQALARDIDARAMAARMVWCIFDNTAAGAATEDALSLSKFLDRPRLMPASSGD